MNAQEFTEAVAEMDEGRARFNQPASTTLAQAALESDLIPTGYYQFQVADWKADTSRTEREFWDAAETKPNVLYNKRVALLRLDLLSRAEKASSEYEPLTRPRSYFLRVCTDDVRFLGTENLIPESKLFGELMIAAKASANSKPLETNSDFLDHFIEHRGVVSISLYPSGVNKTSGKSFNAGNRVNSIKNVRG